MLRLYAPQAQTLWDPLLPIGVGELPADLGEIDALLSDPALVLPIASHWQREAEVRGYSTAGIGRPTIAMQTYVRLMVLKQRSRWGYETLVREVSDSIHLRRFCLVALGERLPDESTIRKLTRRLGAQTVSELCRGVIVASASERRFRARAVRIDSTVVEADVRYPTDAGLAAEGVGLLAREAGKLKERLERGRTRLRSAVRDRSRAAGYRLREISRTLARRGGERKAQVLELTGKAGKLLERSIGESRALASELRAKARGRGAKAKLAAAERLEELAERCEKIAEQVRKRIKGAPISDRIISLHDTDARPIRKGKRGKPTEFGYLSQIAEVTASTKPGQRGFVLPPSTAPGNPHENELLPDTVAELEALGMSPREVALDGGFGHRKTDEQLAPIAPERTFVAGRPSDRSKRTQRRLARYRVGAEGRISHLKRGYGLDRSRLKGGEGHRTWTGWAALAYNLDTYVALG
ncbi:MAG: transposase [Actinobacteria bacterium]|nr:transposase [Actinomycetota bacterium]